MSIPEELTNEKVMLSRCRTLNKSTILLGLLVIVQTIFFIIKGFDIYGIISMLSAIGCFLSYETAKSIKRDYYIYLAINKKEED